MDGLTGLLVERPKLFTAALRSRRKQTRAVSGEQQRLRHKQRSAFWIAGAAQVDAGKGRMFPHILRRLTVRNHPGVLAGVQVDRSNPSPWRFDERQSHRRFDARTTPDVAHV